MQAWEKIDPQPGPEFWLQVLEAVKALPPNERVVAERCFLQRASAAAVAAELDMGLEEIKRLYHRAMIMIWRGAKP